jgi:hypothetical protein
MSNIDYWLNWKPSGEKSNESSEATMAIPTESGSVSFGDPIFDEAEEFCSMADRQVPKLRSWRDWRPPGQISDESNEAAQAIPTGLGSVSFGDPISKEAQEFCLPSDLSDPSDWKEDFRRWMLEHCEYKNRCFCEMHILFRDFKGWSIAHQQVPCSAAGFTRQLSDAGFLFADGLVYGLLLRRGSYYQPGCQNLPAKAKTTTSTDVRSPTSTAGSLPGPEFSAS